MKVSRLIVMAGLPGSGKSSVAEKLSCALPAFLLAVDPIEAAMWHARLPKSKTGVAAYEIAEALTEENLKLGASVIIDAVNPVEAARAMWRRLADRRHAVLTFVECHCSDLAVHRHRVEARVRGIAGMSEVTWARVEERRAEYEPWSDDRISLDTSRDGVDHLTAHVLSILGGG